MNKELQKKLNEIISQYGKIIVKKKKEFESCINSLLFNYPAEKNISIHLSQLDILSEIVSLDTKQLSDIEINRYAKKLADNYGFNFEKCKEMIVMWANVLGVKTNVSNDQKSQSQTNNSYTNDTQSYKPETSSSQNTQKQSFSKSKSSKKRNYLIIIVLFIIGIYIYNHIKNDNGVAMFRANPQHTGVYHTQSVDAFHSIKWRFKTGDSISSSPAVVNGVVYFGSEDGYLYAVNADTDTGEIKWRFKTGDSISSSPAVVNGVVYVGSLDGYLYAVNADTGEMEWRFNTGNFVRSSPAVVNGVVYVGSYNHYLYAVNADTGKMEWRFKTGSSIYSSPVVVNGVVYVGSDDGYLYALH
jgi:outer membrane protein assembly factor BamB